MVINPIDETVTDITPVNQNSMFFANAAQTKELKRIKKRGDVVAMAPKDHLRTLQQDLIKRGYRKVR